MWRRGSTSRRVGWRLRAGAGVSDVIELYDTTLRDGTQGEGISLTLQDKLRITSLLDSFGIHLIEGGWPGSNPKDAEYFVAVHELKLTRARIAAFGSTCRPKLAPEDDANLAALVESQAPVTTIFGKSWTRHVTQVLHTDLDNNLRIIRESVAFLIEADREVIYDAEHFFDGFVEDQTYAIKTLQAAVAGGASRVVLCDTNGGTMPADVERIVQLVAGEVQVPLGIHAHNDGGCAVANSMMAVRAGAQHVQGTINGIGERCGNADLCPIIANLELKEGHKVLPDGNLVRLTEVARTVSELCNQSLQNGAPYVGRSAFAHKGGVHVAALRRDEGSYEHVVPNAVGNSTRILVSELSGRGNIGYKASEFGLSDDDADLNLAVLEQIKELEAHGASFEAAEASVELIMRRQQSDYVPFFELLDFMAVVEHREGRGHLAEANVKIRIDGEVHHTAADGSGPVEALDIALRKALMTSYPAISGFHLTDYKVRILDGSHATQALTRVLIDTSDGERTWSTVGASRNIIEASWRALYDSFEFGLVKAYGARKSAPILAETA
ncbi:MAG: citramalate synthase [Planctomycetes bacterium]|nr:citramalate synthase [Planctomycetota bacterium]